MKSKLDVADLLGRLETQIAVHREREAFHAAQEAKHREERTRHAAELEKLTQTFEALRATATAAADLTSAQPSPPPPPPAGTPRGKKAPLSKLIGTVIQTLGSQEPFGVTKVLDEISRHYRDRLRRPAYPRIVSMTLRRLADQGAIHLVREGRPHHEALFTREKPAKG